MVDLRELYGIDKSLKTIPSIDNRLTLYIHGVIPGYMNSKQLNDCYDNL